MREGDAISNLGGETVDSKAIMRSSVDAEEEADAAGTEKKEASSAATASATTTGTEDFLNVYPCPAEKHFLDLIRETVLQNENRTYATWYDSNGKVDHQRTFGEIWNKAGAIAHHLLSKWNVQKGQNVILCYDFGLHFFEVFFGCLRAGVVAVLVFPPAPFQLKKSLTKLAKVVQDCQPALILTDSNVRRLMMYDKAKPLSKTRNLWPNNVQFQVTDKLPDNNSKHQQSFDEKTDDSDLAFLQYTSGSTGDPKGVMVTYKALATNFNIIYYGIHQTYRLNGGQIPDDKIVGFSWLPQYHDLGLIYSAITPFCAGWRMHMMSPITFIKNPVLWVELMSRHKVQWSAAPEFSFQLVVRKFQEQEATSTQRSSSRFTKTKKSSSQPARLDLSSIRFLMTAAEPCRPETQERFHQTFSEYGLPREWYMSGYGLAENVVAVGAHFGLHLSTPRQEDGSKAYVACTKDSRLHPSLVLKVVDLETCCEVIGDSTGELWIAGPSVAAGYYGKPELSANTFNSQLKGVPGTCFLHTGDLAFIQDGRLYICGRIKDLIIVNGVNYYPQDIEFAVQEASSSVRPGCVAAFTSKEAENEELFDVVFEIRAKDSHLAEKVCAHVYEAVLQQVGLAPYRVIAITERTIPKTTSGKIQRRATRNALQGEELKVVCTWKSSSSGLEERTDTHGDDITENIIDEHDVFGSIVQGVLGSSVNEHHSWEELGLSSMAAVELQRQIADKLLVTLPPTFQEDYPTPKELRDFMEGNKGKAFPIHLPNLKDGGGFQMGWKVFGLCQAIGVLLLLLIIAFSFVPAYHFGQLLSSTSQLKHDTERVSWQWLPFVLPVWMLSFTCFVIIAKWVVIGRYKEQKISAPSISFLRWWFMDRLIHVWEIWVGNLIKDTTIIWLFYSLMGSRIHFTAQIDAFVREFDLVEIGAHTSLQCNISCSKFGTWDSDKGASLRLRQINIGKKCKIQGFIGPGADVGDGSQVERLAALPEGALVSENTLVGGSPAYNKGTIADVIEVASTSRNLAFEAIKLLWLLFELYLFFGFLLFGQWILNGRLPQGFRYTPLLYWAVLLLISAVLNMATCVLFKWLLIGKKHEGPASSSLYAAVVDWIVDYHFRISLTITDAVAENSKLINFYLMALGMDIDTKSHIWAIHCPPSKVDLVLARRSFFSSVQFEPKINGQYHRIQVTDSSFGHSVVLNGGVQVRSAQIAPCTLVEGSVNGNLEQVEVLDTSDQVWCEIFTFIYAACIFWSAVPAYELFQVEANDPLGFGFSVTKFAAVLLIQTITWLFLFGILQKSILKKNHEKEWIPRNQGLYQVYLTMSFYLVWRWSFLSLSFGTPIMIGYLRLLGSAVEGRMLYFGYSSYEFPLLTFSDRTIIDRCVVSGHSCTASGLHIGPTKCAGTVHPGVVVLCDTDLTGAEETGPCQFVAQNMKPADQSEICNAIGVDPDSQV